MENQNKGTAVSDQEIIKVFDKANIFLSCIIILIGAFAFIASFTLNDSLMSLILMAAGCALAVYGVIRCLSKSAKNVYTPTGATVNAAHFYFKPDELDALREALPNGKVPDGVKPSAESNTTVRLDVLRSEDKKFIRLRLMKYDNYIFHPVTDALRFTGTEAENLCNALSKGK